MSESAHEKHIELSDKTSYAKIATKNNDEDNFKAIIDDAFNNFDGDDESYVDDIQDDTNIELEDALIGGITTKSEKRLSDTLNDSVLYLDEDIKNINNFEPEPQLILNPFDDNDSDVNKYHVDIEELNDEETTKMIQTQKEYEKYGRCACGHTILIQIWKFKASISFLLLLACGVAMAEYVIKKYNSTLSKNVFWYTIYFAFLILCIVISKLFVLIIMKILRKCIRNSWSIFYLKGLRNRLYVTILSILWFIALHIFKIFVYYDFNPNIYAFGKCVLISAITFLATHIFIRYISLGSYFDIFRQKTRKFKAYITFISIMLNTKPNSFIFCMPIMNFLIDFPSYQQTKQARQAHKKTVSFKFKINITNEEKKIIIKTAKKSKINTAVESNSFITAHSRHSSFMQPIIENIQDIKNEDIYDVSDDEYYDEYDDEDTIKDKNEKSELRAIDILLNSDLYSVNLHQTLKTAKLINNEELERLTRLISYLIILRLNKVKKKIINKTKSLKRLAIQETLTTTNNNTHNDDFLQRKPTNYSKHRKTSSTGNSITAFSKNLRDTFRGHHSFKKLELLQTKDNKDIPRTVFIGAFKQYGKANKRLLIKLGELAWKKFKDKDKTILNAKVLNMNIIQIIKDLLKLKQSIDSYIIIINNLQRMIDVITPILLLFAYLYVFDFNFQSTISLYVSSVGIIGFFGSSYFSSVFASISFIIALNPYLVGDIIRYKGDMYSVEEISLVSSVFKLSKTGELYTFQNKQLSSTSIPIVNISRSDIMRYRFTLYFKPNINNKILWKLAEACKEEIKKTKQELLELKINKYSNCTYAELKNLNFQSIMIKSVEMDKYQRQKIHVEMEYETFSWNVRTLCFNCVTTVAHQQFKQYICDPISFTHSDQS